LKHLFQLIIISCCLVGPARAGSDTYPDFPRCKHCEGTGWRADWIIWLMMFKPCEPEDLHCPHCSCIDYDGFVPLPPCSLIHRLDDERQQEFETMDPSDLNPSGWLVPSMKKTKEKNKFFYWYF